MFCDVARLNTKRGEAWRGLGGHAMLLIHVSKLHQSVVLFLSSHSPTSKSSAVGCLGNHPTSHLLYSATHPLQLQNLLFTNKQHHSAPTSPYASIQFPISLLHIASTSSYHRFHLTRCRTNDAALIITLRDGSAKALPSACSMTLQLGTELILDLSILREFRRSHHGIHRTPSRSTWMVTSTTMSWATCSPPI